MRYLVIVPTSPDSESGTLPSPDDFAQMGRFNQEMIDAGVMLAAEGLHPTSRGVKIRFDGGTTTVTDGPFTETKEMIAGYWVIQVKSRDEAIAWMRRAPLFDGGMELQLREIVELDDYAPALTPDEIEREKQQRARLADGG